jgi:hypothetical protein
LVTPTPALEMMELPAPWDRVTVCPETGVCEESTRVTVTKVEDAPLSATEVGLAITLDVKDETAPWNVTLAVLMRVTDPVVSMAE